jgi:threonine dehydratase
LIPTLEHLELARERLKEVIRPTPLVFSATVSRMLEAEVFFKPENLQKTGSFKIRGAYNRVASLSASERQRGVVCASAGNHGQALAYAASKAGVKATIVMPESAPLAKVAATRSYGQSVVLSGKDYLSAARAAREIQERTGALFVDAYDDPWVIAGQGSVALEIAEELDAQAVVVPVGGGGLLAGMCLGLSSRLPKAALIAVEARGSPQLRLSLNRGRASTLERPADTIADGLATGKLGELPFELIRGHLSEVVDVDDFEISEAVLLMLERLKLLTEGAGAAALAGALKIGRQLKGKRVVICVTGGNIDINLLDRIIGHGLIRMGRLFRFAVDLRDRPGELGKLLKMIADTGANVRAIHHDRNRLDVAISAAEVVLELDTRGPEHIAALRAYLEDHGYPIRLAPQQSAGS